jgi:hypothetical protein
MRHGTDQIDTLIKYVKNKIAVEFLRAICSGRTDKKADHRLVFLLFLGAFIWLQSFPTVEFDEMDCCRVILVPGSC